MAQTSGHTPTARASLPPLAYHPHRLIIVCCHAIWLGGPSNGALESEWSIEPFQKGETPYFIEHIKVGLELLSADPSGMLVFSGGATKPGRTDLSEAESYLNIARANNYFHHFSTPPTLQISPSTPLNPKPTLASSRTIALDPLATDTYQNILFPLALFYHHTQNTPSLLTIISHAFKKDRILGLHCKALRLPPEKVRFCGVEMQRSEAEWKEIVEGNEKATAAWEGDLYGVREVLGGKRERRGWKGEEQVLEMWRGSGGWLERLLAWEGGELGREVYAGWLPWDEGGV